MKKKILLALIVCVLIFLCIGISSCGKKDKLEPEEAMQSSGEMVSGEASQLLVDETRLGLLEKMMIVKDASVFDRAFLAKSCDLYQAYELLNTMRGQDGAEVSYTCHGERITQKELLTLYLKELFQIEVTEAQDESFAFYVDKLGVTEAFDDQEAEATNNDLFSLVYACVHYGLGDWENIKTVFQQMLESGYFNETDITTFENAAMNDIFNYGTLKCPAKEIYDVDTGRTYYFLTYFGNNYNSVTDYVKNLASIGMHGRGKEILTRPYFSMQNNTSDGTGFVFTRFPGGMAYLYDVETQTTKYIDTVKCVYGDSNYMCVSKSDKLYYIKEVDGKNWIYRKDLKTDSEPEAIVQIESGSLMHISADEKYLSFEAGGSSYKTVGGKEPFLRVDIENKKVEVVANYSVTTTKLPGSNTVNHMQVNPVYPELYFFAHEAEGTYLKNVRDRSNIMNVETGEIITINPGLNPDKTENGLPTVNSVWTHESWSENGEYLYITNMDGIGGDVPEAGMLRVNKDGTHRLYITNLELTPQQWGYPYPFWSNHASASGDDRYCALQGYYITIISQETNQIFPIAQISNRHTVNSTNSGLKSHPYQAHPIISPGDTYLLNWSHYYVPEETKSDYNSGFLGVAYFDFTEIDENELAKGGEVKYNEFVSRLSYEGLDCESETGTFFEKEAIHASAGNYVCFNVDTSIVDSVNETVTISFDYYDNGSKDLKLIYTEALEDETDYSHMENGLVNITRTDTGTWKRAEILVHGNFETAGYYGIDFKIGSTSADTYISNIEVTR